MAKLNAKPLTQTEIIARLEKPKSMRYIRRLINPIFDEARTKFRNAIANIVEREHWGPNFDAYYDVWVYRDSSKIDDFFNKKLLDLQLEKFVAVLAQVKKIDNYNDQLKAGTHTNSKKHSKNGKLAKLRL